MTPPIARQLHHARIILGDLALLNVVTCQAEAADWLFRQLCHVSCMVVVIVSFLTQREDGIGGYIDPRILTRFLSSDIFFHRYTSSDQTFVLPIGYRHIHRKDNLPASTKSKPEVHKSSRWPTTTLRSPTLRPVVSAL